jgi:hypothetical protein
MRETCKSCRYWEKGSCRRNPPQGFLIPKANPLSNQVEPALLCMFPQIDGELWCGEWKGRVELVS